ncbi:LysE family translocator [Vannielia litorea]|uniref:Threonine/homoserine/homoserine lactone efflux protein n=1 Tax=Vannielia litorea TaxID=1217970 RepID=A0A1N6IL05_9RHOB|nr:LysE family translocator [Vannielia litorea]SIO32724.1 Threonine/homoserine/homoserine lactone efflux protein [Vannielia litorea]
MDLAFFLPACFALNLTFGPSNLLALTHGAQSGVRFAFTAALARLAVFAPMIAASALGLGLLLTVSATAFTAVKILGAAYLIWIGLKLLRTRPDSHALGSPAPNLVRAARREALVALGNPKAILIFAAFFPQFVRAGSYWSDYALLGAAFLLLEGCAVTAYAIAGRFAARLASTRMHWLQRASGGTMVGFGLLLLLARAPTRAAA